MSYVVRVIGYDAYWTGEGEVSWTNIFEEAKVFETLEEAQAVVDSGRNMEAVDYSTAQESFGEFTTPKDFIQEVQITEDDFYNPDDHELDLNQLDSL